MPKFALILILKACRLYSMPNHLKNDLKGFFVLFPIDIMHGFIWLQPSQKSSPKITSFSVSFISLNLLKHSRQNSAIIKMLLIVLFVSDSLP